MRARPLFGQTAPLRSLLKWLVLAAAAGAAAGVGTGLFLTGVEVSTGWVEGLPTGWRLLLLPAAGVAGGWLVYRFTPQGSSHGMAGVIKAVHERQGDIDPRAVPVHALATIVGLAGGGSAGKAGPSAQISSGLAALLARWLRLGPGGRQRLATCGIGAGFAAALGAPIGGAIFGLEILYPGALAGGTLLPSLVAASVAYRVTRSFGVHYLHRGMPPGPLLTGPLPLQALKVVLLGAAFGLIALAFIGCMDGIQRLFHRIHVWPPLRPALGGVALAVLAGAAGPGYLGLGLDTIGRALAGGAVPLPAFAWKILFTSATLGSGWSGGLITPIFFIGAAAGNALGPLLGVDPQLGAALGIVGVLAGATKALIAASIIGLELFGTAPGLPLAAVAFVACAASGRRSIYQVQGPAAPGARRPAAPGRGALPQPERDFPAAGPGSSGTSPL